MTNLGYENEFAALYGEIAKGEGGQEARYDYESCGYASQGVGIASGA